MKTKNLVGVILGIICLQLIFWGAISEHRELLLLGVVNAVLLLVLFANQIMKVYFGGAYTTTSLLKEIRPFCEQYGMTILTIGLVRFLLSRFIRGVGSLSSIVLFLARGIAGYITNRSFFKKGLYRGEYHIQSKDHIFVVSVLVIVLFISFNRVATPEILYPLSIVVGFVVYTLGLEAYRSYHTSYKRRRKPLRLLYLGVLRAAGLWSFGTYALQRIDDHTIEKVVIEEKIIYVPVESESTKQPPVIDCYPPTNASCDGSDQGRSCNEGWAQDGVVCVEVIEVEAVDTDIIEEDIIEDAGSYIAPKRYYPPDNTQPIIEEPVEETSAENTSSYLSPGSYIKLRSVLGNNRSNPSDESGIELSSSPSELEKSIKNNNPQSVNDLIKNLGN